MVDFIDLVDSRATNHNCNSLLGFQNTKSLSNGEISFRPGTSVTVVARVVGVVHLYFDDFRSLILDDYLFVPELKRNLISISSLSKFG